jgi:type III restriction enzyme
VVLNYSIVGESYPFNFDDFVKNISSKDMLTPNKGTIVLIDSDERNFSLDADTDAEVVCF